MRAVTGTRGRVRFAVGSIGAVFLSLHWMIGQAEVVATVGTQPISAEELNARTEAKLDTEAAEFESRLHQLRLAYERSRQESRERELNSLIDERLLGIEATARKQTPEQLIAATVPPGVTDQQVRSFYDAQRSQINQPFDAVAPKIKAYMNQNAASAARKTYLDQLREKYHVSVLLEPRRETVAATGPARGPESAPVTLIEFSDFQCPFCGRLEPVIEKILARYPTQVRLIYRNFPLSTLHPDAERAAEAGVCALEQGKFWPMHDAMFSDQNALDLDALKNKARRVGLDETRFTACMNSDRPRLAVADDVKAGDELGIQGTPATLVNGRFVSGSVTEQELAVIIDDELRRAALRHAKQAPLAAR